MFGTLKRLAEMNRHVFMKSDSGRSLSLAILTGEFVDEVGGNAVIQVDRIATPITYSVALYPGTKI